ncbi:MAG: hypothetical protein GOV15_01415 [Candidatus Diapherotrites archaeon]|nr:hypothetical protein [Candidatus Diapherotrites archaeon]
MTDYRTQVQSHLAWLQNVERKLKMPKENVLELVTRNISKTGFGELTLRLDVSSKTVDCVVKNSSIALKHGSSNTTVCGFNERLTAAFAEYAFGEPMHAIETKCLAKGDEYCEFTAKPTLNIAAPVM